MMVELDRVNCIGCGACNTVCPEYWEMGEDGKINLKGMSGKTGRLGWQARDVGDDKKAIGCNRQAADICPVGVIHIK